MSRWVDVPDGRDFGTWLRDTIDDIAASRDDARPEAGPVPPYDRLSYEQGRLDAAQAIEARWREEIERAVSTVRYGFISTGADLEAFARAGGMRGGGYSTPEIAKRIADEQPRPVRIIRETCVIAVIAYPEETAS